MKRSLPTLCWGWKRTRFRSVICLLPPSTCLKFKLSAQKETQAATAWNRSFQHSPKVNKVKMFAFMKWNEIYFYGFHFSGFLDHLCVHTPKHWQDAFFFVENVPKYWWLILHRYLYTVQSKCSLERESPAPNATSKSSSWLWCNYMLFAI